MSKKILVPINFGGLPPIDQVLERLAEAPAAPGVGRVYFDTVIGSARVWTGAAWENLGAGESYTAGDGIEIDAGEISVKVGPGLEVGAAGEIQLTEGLRGVYSQGVGDGVATEFSVEHNLGTRDVLVEVIDNAAPYSTVITDVERPSNTEVLVRFATPPAAGAYRVLVRA